MANKTRISRALKETMTREIPVLSTAVAKGAMRAGFLPAIDRPREKDGPARCGVTTLPRVHFNEDRLSAGALRRAMAGDRNCHAYV